MADDDRGLNKIDSLFFSFLFYLFFFKSLIFFMYNISFLF